ncbi:ERBB-3 BINDING PROTEIN 1 [Diplonema papillatum]|nr:ERBB-3 BINDING PROTEIN 1 [Diplonema papillatum]
MGRGLTRSRSKQRLTATQKRADNRKRSLSKLHAKLNSEDPNFEASDDEYSEEPFEPEMESIREDSVVEKYKLAAKYVNEALELVMDRAVDGAHVGELCKAADELIETRCGTVFNKPDDDGNKVFKGVAFPTSISINDYVAHFAPHEEDKLEKEFAHLLRLHTGDVAKIHLACHVDGYISQVAHTIVVGKDVAKCPHPQAGDVIKAAYTAIDGATKLMRPDLQSSNDAATNFFGHIADDFGVKISEGVLSHRVARWNVLGHSCIISKKVLDRDECYQDVEPVTFGENEVWHVDVVMSTSHNRLHVAECPVTIYKRNDILLAPRIKAAHYVLKSVRQKFLCFPFATGSFDEIAKARLGLQELRRLDMIDPIPAMKTKKADVCARFLWTVMLTPHGVVPLTGPPLPDYVTSARQVDNAACQNILKASLLAPSHPTRRARSRRRVVSKNKKVKVNADEAMDAD